MFGTLPVFIAVVYALKNKEILNLLAELEKHLSCYILRVKSLWLHFFVDLLAQRLHLHKEFRPHLIVCQLLQVLQLALLLNWANHCVAVTVLEEVLDHPPNPVLSLNLIRRSLLLLNSILEVLLGCDSVPIVV